MRSSPPMKRRLFCLLMLLLLAGCSSTPQDNADDIGHYGLIPKGDCASLVVHWVYPDAEFQYTSFDLDLSSLDAYIDPDADLTNGGVNLNNLLGTLGGNRAFFSARAIGIDHDGVAQIIKKKLPIYLHIEGEDGRSYKVRLQYDKTIRD